MGVVDLLEVVHIDDQQREALVVAGDAVELCLECTVEDTAIVEPCEWIFARQVEELLVVRLKLARGLFLLPKQALQPAGFLLLLCRHLQDCSLSLSDNFLETQLLPDLHSQVQAEVGHPLIDSVEHVAERGGDLHALKHLLGCRDAGVLRPGLDNVRKGIRAHGEASQDAHAICARVGDVVVVCDSLLKVIGEHVCDR